MASDDSSNYNSQDELLDLNDNSHRSSSILSVSEEYPSARSEDKEKLHLGTLHLVKKAREQKEPSITITSSRSTTKKIQKPPLYKRIYYRLIYGKPLNPNSTIKKLPPHYARYWAWKYEILRPWEPQPPRNYYKLLHEENPWFNEPPSQIRIFVMLFLFQVFSLACAFLPWLLNIDVIGHRETILKAPSWILPWWFNIITSAFTHVGSAFAIWFIYLTGGFRKHWKIMVPWFIMLCLQALWPDILFSWRLTIASAVICGIGTITALLTTILFGFKMGYTALLLLFYDLWVTYCTVVLGFLVYLNGFTYSM